jgi:hypothetical protein
MDRRENCSLERDALEINLDARLRIDSPTECVERACRRVRQWFRAGSTADSAPKPEPTTAVADGCLTVVTA